MTWEIDSCWGAACGYLIGCAACNSLRLVGISSALLASPGDLVAKLGVPPASQSSPTFDGTATATTDGVFDRGKINYWPYHRWR